MFLEKMSDFLHFNLLDLLPFFAFCKAQFCAFCLSQLSNFYSATQLKCAVDLGFNINADNYLEVEVFKMLYGLVKIEIDENLLLPRIIFDTIRKHI